MLEYGVLVGMERHCSQNYLQVVPLSKPDLEIFCHDFRSRPSKKVTFPDMLPYEVICTASLRHVWGMTHTGDQHPAGGSLGLTGWDYLNAGLEFFLRLIARYTTSRTATADLTRHKRVAKRCWLVCQSLPGRCGMLPIGYHTFGCLW